ncbi:MAG: 2-C-methyl-D-erythritol 4-phosphate cytidylyltransferase [Acidobacteriota bacterium]
MNQSSEIGLILAASGSGTRFGSDVPKQFLPFDGRPLYLHALRRFSGFVGRAVVAVPATWVERVEKEVQGSIPVSIEVIAGGGTRQSSVEKGLKALPIEIEYVLVHDAARPFVSRDLIVAVSEGMRRFDACIPVLPIRDTVKEIADTAIVRTIPRERLGLAQTPQGFRASLLRRAVEQAQGDRVYGTDEAFLVERLGITVRVVQGDPENVKITWSQDLPGLTP